MKKYETTPLICEACPVVRNVVCMHGPMDRHSKRGMPNATDSLPLFDISVSSSPTDSPYVFIIS